jgi:hypothetical protein
MKKQLLLLGLTLVLCLSLTGPFGFSQDTTLTPNNPLKVDMKNRSVTILAEVNGKHAHPTHHGVVFEGGKIYFKSIFTGFFDPKTLQESLVSVGSMLGNGMAMGHKEKTFLEGELLEGFVTWNGARKIYRLDEVAREGDGRLLPRLRLG